MCEWLTSKLNQSKRSHIMRMLRVKGSVHPCTHLAIVRPQNQRRRFRQMSHDAGQVHRWTGVDVQIRTTDYRCDGFCKWVKREGTWTELERVWIVDSFVGCNGWCWSWWLCLMHLQSADNICDLGLQFRVRAVWLGSGNSIYLTGLWSRGCWIGMGGVCMWLLNLLKLYVK